MVRLVDGPNVAAVFEQTQKLLEFSFSRKSAFYFKVSGSDAVVGVGAVIWGPDGVDMKKLGIWG